MFSLVLVGRHVIIRASLAGAGKPLADSTKIEIRDVEHVYQSDFSTVTALASVSLTVADGEFVALLGPSGCGKSSRPAAGISACAAIELRSPARKRLHRRGTEGAEDFRVGDFNHKGRIEKFVGAALCGCPEPVSEGRI